MWWIVDGIEVLKGDWLVMEWEMGLEKMGGCWVAVWTRMGLMLCALANAAAQMFPSMLLKVMFNIHY